MKSVATSAPASRIALAIVAAATLATMLRAQAPPRPGQYELTAKFAMPGAEKMPPRRDVHCYTADEMRDLGKQIGRGTSGQQCKDKGSKQTGSTLTFSTECLDPSGTTILTSGTVTYTSAESFHAVVTTKDASGKADDLGSMTLDITAKRVGDCK